MSCHCHTVSCHCHTLAATDTVTLTAFDPCHNLQSLAQSPVTVSQSSVTVIESPATVTLTVLDTVTILVTVTQSPVTVT